MTAWDFASGVFNQSVSISAQDSFPTGIFFRADGLKMYHIGDLNNRVYEYDLTIPFDISTLSFNQSLGTNILDVDVFFKPDGLRMFILDSGFGVVEYNLSTAWDISTAVIGNFKNLPEDSAHQDMFFRDNGLIMYTIGSGSSTEGSSDRVYRYNLSTPWDVTTAVFNQSFHVVENLPTGIFFKPDGLRMFVTGAEDNSFGSDSTIWEYPLTVPFDISSTTPPIQTDITLIEPTPRGSFFQSNGTKFYHVGQQNTNVYEYILAFTVPDIEKTFTVSALIQASGAIGNCQDEQIQSWRSNRSGSNINQDQQFSHFRLQPLHEPSSTPLILGQEVTHIRVTKGIGGTSKFTLAIYSGPGLGFPTCIGAGCSSPLNTQLRAFTDETSFVGTADNDFLDVPLLTPYFIDSTDHEDIQVCIAVNPVLQPGHNRVNPAQSWRSDSTNSKRRRITYIQQGGTVASYPDFPPDFLLNESDEADEGKFFQLVLAEPAKQRECFDIDANIKLMPEKTFTVDGLINITQAIGGILDGVLIKEGNTKEFIIDGIIKGLDINKTFTIDALPFDKPARLFSVNALLKELDKTVDFFIDARIRQGNQTTFFIDGLPKGANTEITLIDARIVQINQKVFGIDAKIAKLKEFTIDTIIGTIQTPESILFVESVIGRGI